jgi:hypothetical protein
MLRRLPNTLPKQREEETLAPFDVALHLLVPDVVVNPHRVELDVEVAVFIGWDDALGWDNGEVLTDSCVVPDELARDIPEVYNLHLL